MSNDRKSTTPKSEGDRCPGCGAIPTPQPNNAKPITWHAVDCPTLDEGRERVPPAATTGGASSSAPTGGPSCMECGGPEIPTGDYRHAPGCTRRKAIPLLERDRVRIDALTSIGRSVKGVIGAFLEGQDEFKRAAEAPLPAAAKMDAVFVAGTNAVGRMHQALGGVERAVRSWPSRQALQRTTARYVVRRRGSATEDATIEGDADTEPEAHEAFDVVMGRLQLELPARGGVLELCERRPGGYSVKRRKKIEAPK